MFSINHELGFENPEMPSSVTAEDLLKIFPHINYRAQISMAQSASETQDMSFMNALDEIGFFEINYSHPKADLFQKEIKFSINEYANIASLASPIENFSKSISKGDIFDNNKKYDHYIYSTKIKNGFTELSREYVDFLKKIINKTNEKIKSIDSSEDFKSGVKTIYISSLAPIMSMAIAYDHVELFSFVLNKIKELNNSSQFCDLFINFNVRSTGSSIYRNKSDIKIHPQLIAMIHGSEKCIEYMRLNSLIDPSSLMRSSNTYGIETALDSLSKTLGNEPWEITSKSPKMISIYIQACLQTDHKEYLLDSASRVLEYNTLNQKFNDPYMADSHNHIFDSYSVFAKIFSEQKIIDLSDHSVFSKYIQNGYFSNLDLNMDGIDWTEFNSNINFFELISPFNPSNEESEVLKNKILSRSIKNIIEVAEKNLDVDFIRSYQSGGSMVNPIVLSIDSLKDKGVCARMLALCKCPDLISNFEKHLNSISTKPDDFQDLQSIIQAKRAKMMTDDIFAEIGIPRASR